MVDMVAEMITCSICVEVIADPRHLQCLHTYCYKCLVQYLTTKDKKDEIECPECRKWCPLPNGNLDELPVSFLYNQLKDAHQSTGNSFTAEENTSPLYVCTTPECSHRKATRFCEKCGYICSECENQHRSINLLRKHVTLSLDEASQDDHNDLPKCPKHSREQLKLYCHDCDFPICLLCYPLGHAQHKCAEIIEQSSVAKDKLRETVDIVSIYLTKCEKMKKRIEEHNVKMTNNVTEFKKRVATSVETIHKEIYGELNSEYTQIEKRMEAETDRVNMLHMTLTSIQLCGTKLLQCGKPCDFFQTVSSIQKQLEAHNPDNITLTLNQLDLREAKRKLDKVTVKHLQHNY